MNAFDERTRLNIQRNKPVGNPDAKTALAKILDKAELTSALFQGHLRPEDYNEFVEKYFEPAD